MEPPGQGTTECTSANGSVALSRCQRIVVQADPAGGGIGVVKAPGSTSTVIGLGELEGGRLAATIAVGLAVGDPLETALTDAALGPGVDPQPTRMMLSNHATMARGTIKPPETGPP